MDDNNITKFSQMEGRSFHPGDGIWVDATWAGTVVEVGTTDSLIRYHDGNLGTGRIENHRLTLRRVTIVQTKSETKRQETRTSKTNSAKVITRPLGVALLGWLLLGSIPLLIASFVLADVAPLTGKLVTSLVMSGTWDLLVARCVTPIFVAAGYPWSGLQILWIGFLIWDLPLGRGLLKARKWAWVAAQVWAALMVIASIFLIIAYVMSLSMVAGIDYGSGGIDVLLFAKPYPIDLLTVSSMARLATFLYLRRKKVLVYFGIETLAAANKYQRLLKKADRLAASNKGKKALPLVERIITELRPRRDLAADYSQCLGLAYLARGHIQEQRDQDALAAESYLAAQEFVPLPGPALSLLALYFATENNSSDKPIDIYLKYLEIEGDRSQLSHSDPVLAILERLCTVKEEFSPAHCIPLTSLNERVIQVRPTLEWAHYYLGLALFIRRAYDRALVSFGNVERLNHAYRNADYFSKVCKGLLFEKNGEITKALKILQEAISIAGDMPEAQYNIARILIDQCGRKAGDDQPDVRAKIIRFAKSAVKNSARAVSLRPGIPDYHFCHGRACSLVGDANASVAAFRKAIELDDKIKEYHLHLAIELGRLSLFAEGLESVGRAVALDKEYADAHQVWGDLLVGKGEYKQAVQLYRRALTLDDKHNRARLGLGKALFLLGLFNEAITQLINVQTFSKEGAFLLSRCYSLTGKFSNAIPLLEKLTSGPEPSPDWFYYLGCAHANLGQFAHAASALSTCLDMDSSHWRAYLERGHCHVKAAELDKAIADYEKGLLLQPAESGIRVALTRCYILKGDLVAAQSCLNSLVKEQPSGYEANMLLGAVAEKGGDPSRSEKAYLEARWKQPQSASPVIRLGILCCKQGRYNEAIQHLEAASGMGGDTDAVLYYLGLAKARCENYGPAMDHWKALARRHAEDQRLTLNIHRLEYLSGCQYIKEEKYEEAAAAWGLYLAPRPEDKKLRRELAEVHFRAGVKYLSNGSETIQARKWLGSAVDLNGEHPVASYFMALTDLLDGNPAQAIKSLHPFSNSQAPALRIRARYHQAIALMKMGQHARAAELLGEVAKDPVRSEIDLPVDWVLAVAYALDEQWENALEVLKIKNS